MFGNSQNLKHFTNKAGKKMAYYFAAMNKEYLRLILLPTSTLMSVDGRDAIANTLKSCCKKYGRNCRNEMYAALINAGAIYPQLAENRPINRQALLDFSVIEMMN